MRESGAMSRQKISGMLENMCIGITRIQRTVWPLAVKLREAIPVQNVAVGVF